MRGVMMASAGGGAWGTSAGRGAGGRRVPDNASPVVVHPLPTGQGAAARRDRRRADGRHRQRRVRLGLAAGRLRGAHPGRGDAELRDRHAMAWPSAARSPRRRRPAGASARRRLQLRPTFKLKPAHDAERPDRRRRCGSPSSSIRPTRRSRRLRRPPRAVGPARRLRRHATRRARNWHGRRQYAEPAQRHHGEQPGLGRRADVRRPGAGLSARGRRHGGLRRRPLRGDALRRRSRPARSPRRRRRTTASARPPRRWRASSRSRRRSPRRGRTRTSGWTWRSASRRRARRWTGAVASPRWVAGFDPDEALAVYPARGGRQGRRQRPRRRPLRGRARTGR